MPRSSNTSALARRARRCAAEPSRASSIRSRRDSGSRKPARIMPTVESGPRRLARGRPRILRESGYTLRQAAVDVPDELLAHLSPLGWEHVNLTGDYVWGGQHSMSENTGGLRALRTPQEALATAA